MGELTMDELLEKITPTVRAVSEWVRARSPDECGVEFGLKLGGEAGVMVAKGTAEVNFVVKLTWKEKPVAVPCPPQTPDSWSASPAR